MQEIVNKCMPDTISLMHIEEAMVEAITLAEQKTRDKIIRKIDGKIILLKTDLKIQILAKDKSASVKLADAIHHLVELKQSVKE